MSYDLPMLMTYDYDHNIVWRFPPKIAYKMIGEWRLESFSSFSYSLKIAYNKHSSSTF
jgi:hypothetical protein